MMKHFSMGSFVSGVMLGALLVGAWSFSKDFVPLPASSSILTTSAEQGSAAESGAVSVTDQSAGSEVVVESVTVPPPGVWVAVREINGNDLGNVLGAARVSGPRSPVSISLLRATEPGRPYVVELYRDDGSGEFDVTANSVYVDFDTGAPVIVHFKTTE